MRWFRPLRRLRPGQVNHRTHRKVLIVDEADRRSPAASASPTSGRATPANEHEWRDTHFRIEGPAVDGLRAAFLDNWAETDPELFDEAVDRFPDQPQAGLARRAVRARAPRRPAGATSATLFRTLLQLAERAGPDHDRVLRARRASSSTGSARPRTGASRSRSCCPARTPTSGSCSWPARPSTTGCSSTASRIWNFQPSMLHAKVMTVDGIVANVGSANLNARSTELDEEINLVVIDDDVVRCSTSSSTRISSAATV